MKKAIVVIMAAISLAAIAKTKFNSMETKKPFTVLVLMNATPQWLSLTRDERSAFMEKEIAPIFAALQKTVNVRLYDSEYFHSTVSDFMIVETTNMDDYQEFIERLRDTQVYGMPYFEIKEIIVGQENRFEDFNEKFRIETTLK